MALTGHWRLNDNAATTTVVGLVGGNATLTGGDTTDALSGEGPSRVHPLSLLGDGIADDITTSVAPDATAGTIAVWFNRTALGSTTFIMGCLDSGTERCHLAFTGSPYYLGGGLGSDLYTGNLIGTTAMAAGTWYHAAQTWDGTTVNLYLNGRLEATAGQVGVLPSANITLLGINPPNYFPGACADARVYDEALSASEILDLYSSGLPGERLIGHWLLNDNAASTTVAAQVGPNGAMVGGNTSAFSAAGPTDRLKHSLDGDGSTTQITTTIEAPVAAGTMMCWLLASTGGAASLAAMGSFDSVEGARAYIGLNASSQLGAGIGAQSWAVINSGVTVTREQWYHVAVTWDGSTVSLYVDGDQVYSDTQSGTPPATGDDFILLMDAANVASSWDGKVADCRLYDAALSQPEVQNVMESAGSRLGAGTSAVGKLSGTISKPAVTQLASRPGE